MMTNNFFKVFLLGMIFGICQPVSGYQLRIPDPTGPGSRDIFRLESTANGELQVVDEVEIPLLITFVASTTAGALLTATAITSNPFLVLNAASGSARIRFVDAVAAPIAFSIVAAHGWATGGDLRLCITASSSTNVASRTYVSASVSKNFGAYTAVTSTAATYKSSAVGSGFDEYEISFAALAALETVVPGDLLSFKIYRQELTTTAATGSLDIQNIRVRWNEAMPR